jgi:hypothetical protein
MTLLCSLKKELTPENYSGLKYYIISGYLSFAQQGFVILD